MKVIKPLENWVIVNPDKPKDQTDGGIYIPEVSQDTMNTGKVVATGPTVEAVKEGDTVFFGNPQGKEFDWDDRGYLAMREPEILAILEENGEA